MASVQAESLAGNQLIDWRGPSGNLAPNFAGYLNSQTLGGAPYWKQLAAFAPPAQCLAPPPPPPPPLGTPTALPTPTPAPTILPGARSLPLLPSHGTLLRWLCTS